MLGTLIHQMCLAYDRVGKLLWGRRLTLSYTTSDNYKHSKARPSAER